MSRQLREVLSRSLFRLHPALGFARANRFWLECGGVALLASLAAMAAGRAALDRAETLGHEALHLERTGAGIDRWVQEFQPSTAAETLAWHASRESMERLRAESVDLLSVARLVTQRAREVGLTHIRIRIEAADSLSLAADRPVERDPGPNPGSEIGVEFDGDLTAVTAFAGVLPPHVEIRVLHLSRTGDGLRSRLLLFIRPVEPES